MSAPGSGQEFRRLGLAISGFPNEKGGFCAPRSRFVCEAGVDERGNGRLVAGEWCGVLMFVITGTGHRPLVASGAAVLRGRSGSP